MLKILFQFLLPGLFFIVVLRGFDINYEYEFGPGCSHTRRDDIENRLSTKTPYRVVANYDTAPLKFPGCQAQRIWSLIRHGSRNPSKEVIEMAQNTLNLLKDQILSKPDTEMCEEELRFLRMWQWNVTGEEEKHLVAEGEDELIDLAERFQKRFPDILPSTYDPTLYYFKYTATQRTLESAKSFATGLFGRDRIREIIYPEALHKDPILRFYKLCERWKIDIDKNPETYDNVRKFLQGPEMLGALEYMKYKTQIDDITPQHARLIYTICAFETAWTRHRPTSVWCSLFNRDTIKVLEFAEDLEYYWNDGYGYDLTHQIACPAIGDMFEFIDPNSKKPNATFYFTHSGTLLKTLAHLGLYRDEKPLTYKDFAKQRLWRTSDIDAFATNLSFILYKCEKQDPMILILHQERPIRISGCPAATELCSLKTLRKLFTHSLENCNFDDMCNITA